MEGDAVSVAPPPRVAPRLGTYQLVVIDHDQLHILGLTVHCRVAPADLGGGWALGISPLPAWHCGRAMDRLRDSSHGQTQGLQPGTIPVPEWQGSPPSPASTLRQAAPVSPPRARVYTRALGNEMGRFHPEMFPGPQPHQSEPFFAPAMNKGVLLLWTTA